ncbi:MAG: hypothetical protein AAFQ53_09010 [Bacteroidota bacterium]
MQVYASLFLAVAVLAGCAPDSPPHPEPSAEPTGLTGSWSQVSGSEGTSIRRLRLEQDGTHLSGSFKGILNVRFERDVEGTALGDSLWFGADAMSGASTLDARGVLGAGDTLRLVFTTPGPYGGTFDATFVRNAP